MRFILVDEVIDLTPGRSITACKHVAVDEDYFRDHFPGFPVVPGVLLTEMMAQAAGKCLRAETLDRGQPMLAQIKAATFRRWVEPGKTVVLHATVSSSRSLLATAECRAEVDGKEVCSAELLFTFLPQSQFAPDLRDEVLERYLAQRTAPASGS